jgi:CPA1 family monovalent cation:H+ antiporter
MRDIEFLIMLLLAVALLAQLAGRLRVPYPVFLVLGGLAIAVIPGVPRIQLGPDIVFLVFLPPLLYAAALNSSPRDLRANAGQIALLAVALVVLTVVVVAAVAQALIGDLSWPMAFVLGAVLAPTDPVAASSVFRRTDVPERVAVIVEGEALVNDGVGRDLLPRVCGSADGARGDRRRRDRPGHRLGAAPAAPAHPGAGDRDHAVALHALRRLHRR